MNRAFLIIFIPAYLVSLGWLTFGWGLRVSVPFGIVVLALAVVFMLLLRRRRNQTAGR